MDLENLDILAILGVSKLDPNQAGVVTSDLQNLLLENFFKNILVKYVSKEELDNVVAKKNDTNSLADALEGLIKKYPVLGEEFKKSINDYKVLLMKDKIEEYKNTGLINASEYETAKSLIAAQDWDEVYSLIVKKDADNYGFSVPE